MDASGGPEWELHVAESPMDLWRVNGLEAPKAGSEGEKQWIRENKARPYAVEKL